MCCDGAGGWWKDKIRGKPEIEVGIDAMDELRRDTAVEDIFRLDAPAEEVKDDVLRPV